MAVLADKKLRSTLSTTLELLDRFPGSLNSPPADGTALPTKSPLPSPLPLLSSCAATLRAQTTKLSLLVITPPFTPSAISNTLASLNDAILPSLLTATLLLTPSSFTTAYSSEAISLTRATLRDLKDLAHLVETRFRDGKPKAEPTTQQKSQVTAATGKIWEDCDDLKKLADDGIAGFVVKKAEQHLELIKDAVKEIEDWDPEDDEDEDGFFDDDDDDDDDQDITSSPKDNQEQKPTSPPNSNEKATQEINDLKSTLLKTLLRIPQSLHVVIAQRLKKGLPPALTTRHKLILDRILKKMEQTSTCIDDAAERLYTADALGAMLTVEKARACVVEIVEAVVEGWDVTPRSPEARREESAKEEEGKRETKTVGHSPKTAAVKGGGTGGSNGTSRPETKEDRYIARALEWIKSVGVQTTDLEIIDHRQRQQQQQQK